MTGSTVSIRLRAYRGEQHDTTECFNGLRDEAADLIDSLIADRERLRAELAAWKERERQWLSENALVEDENTRLRAEVERLNEGWSQCNSDLLAERIKSNGLNAQLYDLRNITLPIILNTEARLRDALKDIRDSHYMEASDCEEVARDALEGKA